MTLKCQGCGAVIQTEDCNLPGYIRPDVLEKRGESFCCERCYNLVHYNRNLDVEINEEELFKKIKEISKEDALVVNIVDVFDLEGTFLDNLDELFPNNKKLIVANKFDLFLSSVKSEKVLAYFRKFLRNKNLDAAGTVVMSSFKRADIEKLLHEIFRLKGKRDVCFVGTTNVGKSSIINAVIKQLGLEAKPLTTSSAVSTTIGLIKIPLPDGSNLIDTPGIPNHKQATYYLAHNHQKLLLPRKYIRPRIYQLQSGQTLFIGGFCRLDFVIGEDSSFVVNVPNAVVVHRTKLQSASDFYQFHKDDILKIPDEAERAKLGEFKEYQFHFDKEKREIAISGLGFITLIGTGKVNFYCFEKINVSIREAIV